jgi:TolB-like protein
MGKSHSKFVILFGIIAFLAFCQSGFAASKTFDHGIDYLADRITSDMGQRNIQYIAVVDFTDLNGRISELGIFVSEELLTRLYDTQKVKIVERRLLDKVLEEHRLGLTALFDEDSIKQLGKILGVEAICTGTITDLRATFKINARVIAVETGQVFAVAATEVDKNDALRILMKKYSRARRVIESQQKSSADKLDINLLVNGGFVHQYTGWKRQIGDVRQGSSKTEIIDFPTGKSGKALHVRHKGKGHILFSQIVNVPSADLIFTATFQASTREGMIKAFSGTGVVQIALQYFDQKGYKVGQTVLLNYIKNPFADTPLIGVPRRQRDTYKTHYIELPGDKLYHDYHLDVRMEIEDNLLGIDSDSIEEIAVILWCGANHSQAGAELWITDVALRTK